MIKIVEVEEEIEISENKKVKMKIGRMIDEVVCVKNLNVERVEMNILMNLLKGEIWDIKISYMDSKDGMEGMKELSEEILNYLDKKDFIVCGDSIIEWICEMSCRLNDGKMIIEIEKVIVN